MVSRIQLVQNAVPQGLMPLRLEGMTSIISGVMVEWLTLLFYIQ
jgi:uncharacterized protein YjeT (DUF2065 family)